MVTCRAAIAYVLLMTGIVACSQVDSDGKGPAAGRQEVPLDAKGNAPADPQPGDKIDARRVQAVAVGGPRAAAEKAGPDDQAKPPRVDRHGEALPPGAIARVGTARWRHRANVFAYSPDGKFLVAAGDVVALLDARSGTFVRQFGVMSKFGHEYRFAAFSLDGKTLFAATEKWLKTWDVATGRERHRIPMKFGRVSMSADCKLALRNSREIGKRPLTIALMDMDSGKEIRSWTEEYWGPGVLAPDGKSFAQRNLSDIAFYDCADGKELRRIKSEVAPDDVWVPKLVYSADGKFIAGTERGQVRVWAVDSGKVIHRFAMAGDGPQSLALSADGRLLAAGGSYGSLYLWELSTGKLVHAMADASAKLQIHVLAFSPDNKTLATQALYVPAIRLWNVASGREITAQDANSDKIDAVAFTAGAKSVLTLSEGTILLKASPEVAQWDIATGKLVRRFTTQSPRRGSHRAYLALPPRGDTVFASFGTYTAIWDMHSGKDLGTLGQMIAKTMGPNDWEPRSHFLQVYPHCSPDGKKVVVAYLGKLIEVRESGKGKLGKQIPVYALMLGLLDPQTGKLVRSFEIDAGYISSLALAADGRTLVGSGVLEGGGGESLIFVWDLVRGVERRRVTLPLGEESTWVAVLPDGKTAISGERVANADAEDAKVHMRLWDIDTGKERAKFAFHYGRGSAAGPLFFSDRLAATVPENVVEVFNPSTGKVLRRFKGHRDKILALAFSADGKYLASGSADTSVLVWDLSDLAPADGPAKVEKRR